CYSSFPSSVNNPSGEFIAGWFPSPDMPTINSLEITPRIVYGTVLSFPPSFDLYVTSEDNSRWVFVKTYFQSELTLTAEEKYVVPLAKSFQTWGILIVPKEIGFDDYGNYYFQLCGIKALLQR
ncbi:MAG: hypothetical protein KDD35_03985, partial [Bdellovibrionales bacterium]|nr:hypothetical protein [Bdellovibrionales bacterium]